MKCLFLAQNSFEGKMLVSIAAPPEQCVNIGNVIAVELHLLFFLFCFVLLSSLFLAVLFKRVWKSAEKGRAA